MYSDNFVPIRENLSHQVGRHVHQFIDNGGLIPNVFKIRTRHFLRIVSVTPSIFIGKYEVWLIRRRELVHDVVRGRGQVDRQQSDEKCGKKPL